MHCKLHSCEWLIRSHEGAESVLIHYNLCADAPGMEGFVNSGWICPEPLVPEKQDADTQAKIKVMNEAVGEAYQGFLNGTLNWPELKQAVETAIHARHGVA